MVKYKTSNIILNNTIILAEELSLLSQVGFPSVQPCVNYLSGGIDGVRGYEPRADWQHRKYFSFLQQYKLKIVFYRNAKFVDFLCLGVSHNTWQCSTSWSFWCLSSSNKCSTCNGCHVFISRFVDY